MFRKIVSTCALSLAVGLLAAGCSDDDDDKSGDSFFIRVGNFPGNQVQDNLAASDRWGWSPNDSNVGEVQIYWNVANGNAMAVMSATENHANLYLSFFNGGNFQDLQEVFGEDHNADAGVSDFTFMWIGGGAAAWSGHGILLYTRNDQAPTTPVQTATEIEDENLRLYGAVVNSSGTLLHDAVILDFDHQVGDTGGMDTQDTDVVGFGFVSDSLHCTHEFGDYTTSTESGEATSAIHIVFGKNPTQGVSSNIGDRMFALTVDLTTTPIDATSGDLNLPVQGTALGGEIDPASGGLATGEDTTNDYFVVHNNWLIFEANIDASTDSDDETSAVRFNSLGVAQTLHVGPALNSGDYDGVYVPNASDVYGFDHGLSALYIITGEAGNTDGNNGSRAGEFSVGVTYISDQNQDGTFTADTAEIDAWQSLLDTTSVDADGVDVLDGSQSGVASYSTAMTRGGDIFVLFWQYSNDVTDEDDADATETSNANLVLWMNVVQTTSTGNAWRDLTDSVPAAGAVQIDCREGTLAQAQFNVFGWDWQIGLGQGQAVGQLAGFNDLRHGMVTCDRECIAQSVANTVHVYFAQQGDLAGNSTGNGTAFRQTLSVGGATMTDNDTSSAQAAPTIALTGTVEIDDVHNDWGGVDTGQVAMIDNGANAGVVIFYSSQTDATGDRQNQDTTTGSYEVDRLYVRNVTQTSATVATAGTEFLVSTDGDAIAGREETGELPPGEIIVVGTGHVGGATNSGVARVDVFWRERSGNQFNSARILGTRSFAARSFQSSSTLLFEDAFTPALDLGFDPEFIDNPEFWALESDHAVFTNGGTVGVYFEENQHLFYQESGSGSGGYGAGPQLMDNFNAHNVNNWGAVPGIDCGGLAKSIVFWIKNEPTGNDSDQRAYVRVHN